MDVNILYIFGINANNEIVDSVDNLESRYRRKSSGVEVRKKLISPGDFKNLSRTKSKVMKRKIDVIFNDADKKQKKSVGIYLVFHGGTANPIDVTSASKLVLKVMDSHAPKSLVKVVMLACYYASTPIMGDPPIKTFCTKLEIDCPESKRTHLPMIAAWDTDVYVDKKGHKQTKVKNEEGTKKYINISRDSKLRNDKKVICVRQNGAYALKSYAQAGEVWHDGAVETKEGQIIHVKG